MLHVHPCHATHSFNHHPIMQFLSFPLSLSILACIRILYTCLSCHSVKFVDVEFRNNPVSSERILRSSFKRELPPGRGKWKKTPWGENVVHGWHLTWWPSSPPRFADSFIVGMCGSNLAVAVAVCSTWGLPRSSYSIWPNFHHVHEHLTSVASRYETDYSRQLARVSIRIRSPEQSAHSLIRLRLARVTSRVSLFTSPL
jgi:hypothetical protein